MVEPKRLTAAVALWALVAVLGCYRDSTDSETRGKAAAKSAERSQSSFDARQHSNKEAAQRVVVLGDNTIADVVARLEKAGFQTSTNVEQAEESALIVMVQNSQQGPLAVHRQLAASLPKRNSDFYLWIFTNSSPESINDRELLELEELECRDIFNANDLPGDDVSFAFDSEQALVANKANIAMGWKQILEQVKTHLKD